VKVVLETTHLAPIGGAENYLMRLAETLDEISDFSVVHNWPEDFRRYNGFGKQFKVYDGLSQPDIFIHCSHFRRAFPIGRRNYAVALFPKVPLKPIGYDGVISICEYSARWVRTYWGTDSFVLYPCIDPKLYCMEKKERQIVSIGHFFEEEDGHSKNQKVLVDAFSELDGYKLILIGNANRQDKSYLRKVRRAASEKNVEIIENATNDEVKSYLAKSSHLWHANGFGRTDPAQTEHFGIIVLEAIASGAVPIVHASGGAQEISGAVPWSRPEELPKLTLERTEQPKLDGKYTVTYFRKQVAKWLESVPLT
jgi:glycosyltransferase involved in cell wall biosynthesis